jgi:UDP-N-acetylmuramate dehydrogenase
LKVNSRELKDIFSEGIFEGEVKFMEPMRDHTSLRIGGPADIFAVPQDILSLSNVRARLKRRRVPFFPMGGGTNILVRDGGIEGTVISFRSLRKIETVKEDDENVYLFVRAGALLQRLVNFSMENGYSGLEGLVGIPGTVGGAICGNAGAFGYEMKDILVSVEIMDSEGKIDRFKAEGIAFGYRSSGISQNELLLSAEIKLRKDKKEDISARIEDFLKIKREKQPVWEHSAGCVFKNPPGSSAGKLIDEAGCKSMRIGDVEVSAVHANFFINKGKASAADFIMLIEEVAARVKERSNVVLEPEIRIVGRESVNG